jgi:predicted DNA-binding transcriptional regulator AlpA
MGAFDYLPTEIVRSRVLDTAEAAAFCNFSVPHWRRLYRARKVPPPMRLSTRKYGWRLGDLVDWIDHNRARGRNSGSILRRRSLSDVYRFAHPQISAQLCTKAPCTCA